MRLIATPNHNLHYLYCTSCVFTFNSWVYSHSQPVLFLGFQAFRDTWTHIILLAIRIDWACGLVLGLSGSWAA